MAPDTGGFAANPWWQQAQAGFARGQPQHARTALARLREAGSGNGLHAQLIEAQFAWYEDRVREACTLALAAAHMAPDDNDALYAVASLLLNVGESASARDCLGRMSLAGCQSPLFLVNVAALHKRLEQHDESLALLDQAEALGNVIPPLRYARGWALGYHGRFEEAEAELSRCLTEAPDHGSIAVPLVNLRRQTPERNWLAMIEIGARNARIPPVEQAAFEFARYKTLEDLERYDDAWEALARGNALMRGCLRDETVGLRAWLQRFLAAQPPTPPGGVRSRAEGPMPIFIVGMPRSGTTLLERMLGNHSQVADAGELLDFRQQLHWAADTHNMFTDAFIAHAAGLDYHEVGRRYLAQTQWRANGKRFYIDKQPPNWLLAGAIHAALPQAPILNLVRDPVDTCFSNWRAFFGDAGVYSYDLAATATQFRDYQHAMAHWRRTLPGAILDVDYAALVDNPDRVLQQVFEFCGLESEPGCADLARNASPSGTLSAVQVRASLESDSAGRWRHYATQLAPLLEALGEGERAAGS